MPRKVALSLAILLCLTAVAHAIPTIVVGNHNLLPNTAGQTIPINVTGISANEVNGITFSVMINDGGVAYGGTPGPIITGMDFDTGPTIWMPPSVPTGHNPPATFFDGQLASANFLTVSGFVTASSGLVVTLTIDTTGFGLGVYSVKLIGTALEENVGNTGFIGNITEESITNGTITYVPEPSSVVLGLFAVAGFGVVAIRKRRTRRA
jgi:opacity protein-like surface antigen